MKKNALRIVALVLSVIMTLGAMTVVSFADGETAGTSLHVDPNVSNYTTWVTTFDAVALPDGYNTIKYDYTMQQLVEGNSPGYHSTRVFAKDADGAVVINNEYGCHGIGGDLAYVDGFVSGTATVNINFNAINRTKLSEFGILIRGNRAAVYTFSNVRATNGTDEILLSSDGGQKYAPDYLYETDAKMFKVEPYTSQALGANPGYNIGYSFDEVDLTGVSNLTVNLTVNTPVENLLMDGPGYHRGDVYLFDVNGNSVLAANGITPHDTLGNLNIDVNLASFANNPYFDRSRVNRIEFDFCVNRTAFYALDGVKFDGVEVDDLAIVSVTRGAIPDSNVINGANFSFSFDAPVDMSEQTTFMYRQNQINSAALDAANVEFRERIVLTDANGKMYYIHNEVIGNDYCPNDPRVFSSIVDAGNLGTAKISAEAATAIGFDLANVVQVDIAVCVNYYCAIRIHSLAVSDGNTTTALMGENSELFYNGCDDADIVMNASSTEQEMSSTYAFAPVDVAKFSTLKVNFTPITVTPTTKIHDGPYMWKLVYTLTSSTGTSVEIKSTKDNIGDLFGTQQEALSVAGLEDVASITITLRGNKIANYYFDFSFVNGEGVEKVAVSTDKNILMVGHQRSTEVTNNKMGLRFVAAVESVEGYTEIGFDVASTGKQTASVSGKSVYTSVLGEDGTYYALDNYGYNYLYALEITNIDTTLGTLEFEVTPWAMVNGEKVTFASMTVIYNGATCVE